MTLVPSVNWSAIDRSAGWVPVDANHYVPRSSTASVTFWPGVEFMVGVFIDDTRVAHCRSLEIRFEPNEPGSITSTRLRQLPLAQIMQQIAETVVYERVDGPDGSVTYRPARTDVRNDPMRLSKRRNVDAVLLRRVADVYKAAVSDRPTTAVAEHLGVSHSTAARYVAAARAQGFLGRTRPGQKGVGEKKP